MKYPLLKSNIVPNSLASFLKRDSHSCLFFFLVGLILRGIPELLVPFYPVGYETITYYAPPMMMFSGRGMIDVFVEFFRDGPLFYVMMWLVSNVTGAHAFVILKFVGPLLYGGLVVSFFVFLRKGLRLNWKVAFIATLLLTFQVAALRESWDRFRTVLGLIFLFATLTALRLSSKHKWWLVIGLAALTAMSREYVAFVLFVTVFSFVMLEKRDRIATFVLLVPALAIFVIMITPSLPWFAHDLLTGGQGASPRYLWIVQDAVVIFAVCYTALLPFVMKGAWRNRLIVPWMVWLLVSSFSVVNPWFAIPGYQRWLMLLVFPFSIYAARGFELFNLLDKPRVRILKAIILVFIAFGVSYSTGAFSYIGIVPNSYVPVNLRQSSIRWNEIDDVIASLRWLNGHAVCNSSILVEERFYGWTMLYLERLKHDLSVIAYGADSTPQSVLEVAFQKGANEIYLVWYSEQNLTNFVAVHSQNTISIFRYV